MAELALADAPGGATPFDMARAPDGTLYISDPGRQLIARVSPRGDVSVYARFADIRTDEGEPYAEHPAGLAFGPDGDLYVATFAGGVQPEGRSRVYRLRDRNGDGDAADGGERSVAAAGLTAAVDIAFGPDRAMYVVEYGDAPQRMSRRRRWRARGGCGASATSAASCWPAIS